MSLNTITTATNNPPVASKAKGTLFKRNGKNMNPSMIIAHTHALKEEEQWRGSSALFAHFTLFFAPRHSIADGSAPINALPPSMCISAANVEHLCITFPRPVQDGRSHMYVYVQTTSDCTIFFDIQTITPRARVHKKPIRDAAQRKQTK